MLHGSWRSILEIVGLWWHGRRIGFSFNAQQSLLTFDSDTTTEDDPNCLEFDSRVGTWVEGDYEVPYNDLSFDGVL